MVTDLVAQCCAKTAKYLNDRRQIIDKERGAGANIPADSAVVIVALDGAIEHKRNHPYYNPYHYVGFTERCRTVMKRFDGIVLESKDDGIVDYVAVGWFPPDGVAAILAMAKLRESLLADIRDLPGQPWMHERHHIAAIGRDEHAAAHLLQMAYRDVTILDPAIYKRLLDENKSFLELARSSRILLPNYERELDDIENTVDSNVNKFRQLWDQVSSEKNKAGAIRLPAIAS